MSTTTPVFTTSQRLTAEALGTFWLVLGGCGTAVLAGDQVGFAGVALAFGLTVLTGAYAFGPVSGGHFNPAVSVGLATARRFPWKDVPAYAAAEVVGATVAGALLLAIASGKPGFDVVASGFATNGYGVAIGATHRLPARGCQHHFAHESAIALQRRRRV